ncbi:hypothetical protein AQJ54_40455 [Streptomyces griseorubiginosus]|uniref:SseB protein N-terminal domain-containing protein n=1 Tax=Streptomyces griseorubiginosus TaxID=67304 RepID=A0A101RP67_9ACTN|nr:hypothetical protein AQJ54_40455 [Streptomyces griseorubiginosus]
MSGTPEGAEGVASTASQGAEGGGEAPYEMPTPPDHVVEAARLAPDHWFGLIDPTWSGQGEPPEWAMIGSWRSDEHGEIVEWQENEDYRPSPRALGWADPTDPVDAAIQLATTDYGPPEDIARALAVQEIAVFMAPGGALLSAVAPDDETPVVPVFTSPQHLQTAGRLSFRPMKAPELLNLVPEGHLLFLNPSGPVSMTLELGPLREAVEAAGVADHEDGWLGALDDLLPASVAADDTAASSDEDGPGRAAVPSAPVAPPRDGSAAAADVARGDFL